MQHQSQANVIDDRSRLTAAASIDDIDLIGAISDHSGTLAVAIITAMQSPAYRPVGAMMLVYCDGRISGSLSSGCIEADIVQHALRALQTDNPIKLKYGANSSWIDLRLPCGGAIEVTIVPRPDAASFQNGIHKLKRREPARLELSKGNESFFQWQLNPPIKLMVFGTGQEALYTARLAIQFGVDCRLFTPEKTLLAHSKKLGILTSLLTTPKWPDSLPVDPWTAITLFFHDHDWEPPLLQGALASAAFYIGAQGSKVAIQARNEILRGLGITEQKIDFIHSPVGLIASARDPRTLALSVLAEVAGVAQNLS